MMVLTLYIHMRWVTSDQCVSKPFLHMLTLSIYLHFASKYFLLYEASDYTLVVSKFIYFTYYLCLNVSN